MLDPVHIAVAALAVPVIAIMRANSAMTLWDRNRPRRRIMAGPLIRRRMWSPSSSPLPRLSGQVRQIVLRYYQRHPQSTPLVDHGADAHLGPQAGPVITPQRPRKVRPL